MVGADNCLAMQVNDARGTGEDANACLVEEEEVCDLDSCVM